MVVVVVILVFLSFWCLFWGSFCIVLGFLCLLGLFSLFLFACLLVF